MLRVSLLELPARWDGRDEALGEADALLGGGPPTDLVVVPELAFTGYVSPAGDFDVSRFAEPIDGPTIDAVRQLCRRRAVTFAAPLVLAERRHVYNALVVVGPDGDVLAVYRKRHPWFPETWATSGTEAPPVLRVGDLDVTFAICFDGHFLARDAVESLRCADLLVFTSAWVEDFAPPEALSPEDDTRMPLLRSLAREFRIGIANANWAPGVVRIAGQGGSIVVDARGELLAAADVDPSSDGGCRVDATLELPAR